MSDPHSTTDRAEVLRRAYREVRKLRARVEELEAADKEPIAIIGMACRFPGGADSPAAFWDLLCQGRDAISEIPLGRWDVDAFFDSDPEAAGKMYTRWGGFLGGVEAFDPQFFGITPREAANMDPQQRLLLEASWEALEDAALNPAKLQGSRTGVFFGLCGYDYPYLMLSGEEDLNAHMGSGSAHSVASGRLSYVLGLQGPSLTLDTACSSALVALHLACRSLRTGECSMALAGAANLVLIPHSTVMFSKARMLAADGRCKAFDASADGYVRSEGCGVVALKRYSEALRAGDRILALIRGSAVNQDGHSTGLTAPNGPAQEAVIREALAAAGKSAAEIGYIETHGTGTPLGDPIEVQALGRVYAESHDRAQPLLLGSVKTNVGHLEAAAGMASLIKTVLAIQHGQIPPSLHFRNPNPRIPWDRLPLQVPTTLTAWPERGRTRAAGISSFGFSGTNVHVILEQAPPVSVPPPEWRRPLHMLCLSGRTAAAVSQLASRIQNHLAVHEADSFEDVCFTANTGRSHFAHRLAVVAANSRQAHARLAAFQAGRGTDGIAAGDVDASRPNIAFLFSGQRSQYAGMGRRLFQSQPVFRSAVLRCEELFRPHLRRPLTQELYGEAIAEIDETIFAQPALFALQYGLTELWRSWGIAPDAVMGHGVGEYAAACAAGVFKVEDAVTLIAARVRLMDGLIVSGSMAVLMASEARLAGLVRPYAGRVDLAAVNGMDHVVVSGESEAIGQILNQAARENIHTQRLSVSHAFHSPLMDPILNEFERAAGALRFATPSTPMVSSVTGGFVQAGELEPPSYWRRHVRETVQFFAGMQTLHCSGHSLFLEIGPSPTLLGMGRRCLPEGNQVWLPSLRKTRDDWEQMMETAAALYVRGMPFDWDAFDRGCARRKISLPTYPFQRTRHWIAGNRPGETQGEAGPIHPLLGRRLHSPLREVQYQAVLRCDRPALLQAHKVHGRIVFPGAGYLEAALSAAVEEFGVRAIAIENMTFHEMLVVAEAASVRLQLILEPRAGDTAAIPFRFLSLPEQADTWTLNASGSLATLPVKEPARVCLEELQLNCNREVDVPNFYRALAARGLQYGPEFQRLKRLCRGEREVLATIDAAPGIYQLHPAMIDACFQAVGALLPWGEDDPSVCIPMALDQLRFHQRAGDQVWCHVEFRPAVSAGSDIISADLRLLGDDGSILVEMEGLRLKRTDISAVARSQQAGPRDHCYDLEWHPLDRDPVAPVSTEGAWLIFPEADPRAREVAREFNLRGETCLLCPSAAEFDRSLNAGRLRGVIYFAPLDESQPCGSLLDVVQGLAARPKDSPPRLCIVTRGADPVQDSPLLEHAPIVGMARVIALEHPELHTLRIDLDVSGAGAARLLVDELAAPCSEDQVVFRGGLRYVPRLVRSRRNVSDLGPCRLEKSGGLIDALALRGHPRQAPGPGEVEIRIRTAGLNFRDVLNALDLYPGEAVPLGCECAGEIVALGDGVQSLALGDEVVALAPGCFGTSAVTAQELAVRKPRDLAWREACTIPIAFLTAQYSLHTLCGMCAGQKILIHAAAGGVGLAAVQLAKRVGAEIFATAGSPEKREYLRSLGIAQVMDSRSLAFSNEILEATRGEGVDVVLNSLSGEFIPRSLLVLKRNGKFLEIGKTGIWDPTRVREFRADIKYYTVALDSLTRGDPGLAGTMLRDIMSRVASGLIEPLPSRVFAMDEAVSAFRYMAQAKHIGKVVLEQPDTTVGINMQADATYLIAGGLGGLGLAMAEWMADCGARNLLLIGRSTASVQAETVLDDLGRRGVRVVLARADIARRDELSAALEEALKHLPPIRGVVHSAGVLDDGVLTQQSRERFAAVLAPKVQGAFNLHELTAATKLDFFVLFSSAASVFGSPGQSSYAAGNAFLDALAYYRRARGLPAVSINWGPWSEVGLAARRDLDQTMRRRGWSPFSPAQAKQLLPSLLSSRRAQVVAASVRWPVFLGQFAGAVPPLLRLVCDFLPAAPKTPAAPGIRRRLDGMPPSRRREMLRDLVHEAACKVLGLNRLDERQPLLETGMDSLMAVELRNSLQQSLERALPATMVFEYPTVKALAAFLSDLLFPEEPAASLTSSEHQVSEAAEGASDISIAAVLESKLAAIESQETK